MCEQPTEPQVKALAQTRFVSLYELGYADGTRYFEASRRTAEDLLATKGEDELAQALPDAVSCCLVLLVPGEEPRMLLFYEYRYPTGQYLLSIPSGLIDARDRAATSPVVAAMVREVAEETGIALGADDQVSVVSPFLFNTPGLTDESTALLCIVAHLDDLDALTQAGAEGTEQFAGFELVTRAQALRILAKGRDPHGHFYPMVAWAALTYFATGLWETGFAGAAQPSAVQEGVTQPWST